MTEQVWGDPPDDAYLTAVQQLFADADRSRTLDALRWQYLHGPAGAGMTRGIRNDAGGLGVHYAVVPRRLSIRGSEVSAVQSLDVMTDEAWKGRGLYLRLAEDVYTRLAERNVQAVYGFPNEVAAPGFFESLGWESLGPVPLVVRPLPTAAVAAPGLHRGAGAVGVHGIVELSEVPESVELLWHRIAAQLRVTAVRDYAFLRWRLDERPDVDYVRLGAFERGRLVGFGALAVGRRYGQRVGQVLDLLVDPAAERSGANLLRGMLSVARRRGCRVALAWNPRFAPNQLYFRRAGFLRAPAALQPVRVFAGVRVFNRRKPELLEAFDPSAWYFSYLDSDSV